MGAIMILRVCGVVLATYLLVHSLGMPWGLLWRCAVEMLFLP
jgi:hypothetical protein